MDFALVAVAVLFSQVMRGVTGFGTALVTVPVVAWVWSPAEAILLAALLDLAGGAAMWRTIRPLLSPALVAAVFLPMIPGQAVGTALLAVLPDDVLRVLVGAVIGLLAIELVVRPVRPGLGELADLPDNARPILAQGAVAGAIGGLMQGVVGAAGPPIVLFARHHFRADFFRANLVAVWFFAALSLLPMMVARGQVGPHIGWELLAFVPLIFLGGAAGEAIALRMSRVAFGRTVGAVLVVAALMLIRSGLPAALADVPR